MVKYETKCKRCKNALGFFKDSKSQLNVDCKRQGKRKARAWRTFCKDFDEQNDFVLINLDKEYSEWRWVKVN